MLQEAASHGAEAVEFGQRNDRQAVAVGQGDDLGLVDDDRLAGLDRQHPGPGSVQVLDGRDADGGHVEPHVLLRLGDLDERPAAGPAELAGALDAAVGPLDGLDGQRGPLLDGDRLADVEPAHLLGQVPAELDVFLLRRQSGARRVRIPSFTSSSGQ